MSQTFDNLEPLDPDQTADSLNEATPAATFGLSPLLRVDPRQIWPHEAHQFTPWLYDHIAELNAAIGFEIELSAREQAVGSFAVDLFGTDVQTGHPAIIENQLEQTNHNHLGQLITYAAGLTAGVIVWVCPKFRPEHRAALTWLNEISSEDVNFFGVELEVLEINGQRAANFKPVVVPVLKGTKGHIGGGSVNPGAPSAGALAYQAFFGELLESLKAARPDATTASKTQPMSWFWISAGRAGMTFAWAFTRDRRFKTEFYINTQDPDRNLEIFEELLSERVSIESRLGTSLEWDPMDGSKAARIAAFAPVEGPLSIKSSPDKLNQVKQWAVPTMVRFIDVFRPWIKQLT
jgi:hypothetical protein